MKNFNKTYLFIIIAILLCPLIIAQGKQEKKKDEDKPNPVVTDSKAKKEEAKEEATEEFIQDLTSTSADVWNPANRREPFSDPVQKARSSAAGDQRVISKMGKRPAGVEGMDLKEIELVGVLFIRGSYKAMFIGSDDLPYILDVDQEIWDSRVKEIDMNCVTFEQETEDIRFLVRRMRTIRRCLESE